MSALPSHGEGVPLPASPADADYAGFVVFLRHQVGIDLDQYKRRQMERRIRAFADRRGMPSLAAYAAILRVEPDELNALLDRITINVSQLFRNPEQWVRLGEQVIPDLAATGNGRIRAWSAGCSFGAEAYSLAAMIKDAAPTVRIDIRASDIDRRILAAAGRGEFTSDDARTAPPELLESHFEPLPGNGWRAGRPLLSVVHFHHEDLLATRPAADSFDLVLCRNVVIYFTPEAREDVHARLAASLRIGGYLVIGSTERIAQSLDDLGLEIAAPFVYRKVS
ncbi:MAG: protein-glutamate O-methyltransferase CheR [Thermoleophilia bacterium]|nr:protein-glutamate O-methyltransferase CheR [Thermoleophilia bacterium]